MIILTTGLTDPNQPFVLILSIHTKRQEKLSKTTTRCSLEIRNQEFGRALITPSRHRANLGGQKITWSSPKGCPKTSQKPAFPANPEIWQKDLSFTSGITISASFSACKVWRLDHCHCCILESWMNSQVCNELFFEA